MSLSLLLSLLTPLDLAALGVTLAAWLLIGRLIEHPLGNRRSVTMMVADYRREWMRQFARREGRIFDATLVSSLRQGTAYFASTTLIALGAILALIGNVTPLAGVAEGLTARHQPLLLWQVKLLPPALFLTHAFLKFVWSHRVFGYCSVLMGAVPADIDDPRGPPLAAKAGELNIRAALNFNRGLRSMYFALGALAWLLGALPLVLAAVIVVWLLWSREFASQPHDILKSPPE